jgi:ABC-type transport system substrate-binding protein
MRSGFLALALALGLLTSQCTSSTNPAESTEPATTQVEAGIAGTLLATGGPAGTPDQPVTGQILVWQAADYDYGDASLQVRPWLAISRSGSFAAELKPGSYVVAAAELPSGLSCGSTTVKVETGEVTTVNFVCQHR